MCYCPIIVAGEKTPVYKCVTVPSLLRRKKRLFISVLLSRYCWKKRSLFISVLLSCHCWGGEKPVYKCVTVPSWLMATSAAVQRPHAPSARAAAPISRSCGAVGDGDGALCSPSAAVAFDRPRSKRQVHGLLHAPIVGQNNVFTLAECLD